MTAPCAASKPPRLFLLAGSASLAASAEVLDRAHEFVRHVVTSVLDAGDGFVVYVKAEPLNEAGQPLLFDWAVLRAIDAYFNAPVDVPRVLIVLHARGRSETMNAEQRRLLAELSARNLAELKTVPDDVVTGGNIGDEQVERAVAMIALGGGKGVADRAHKLMKRGRPVYPLDLRIGALSEDGDGALKLHRSFMIQPLPFLSHTGTLALSKSLALSLEEPVQEIADIAAGVVGVLEAELAAQAHAAPTDVLVLTALPIEAEAVRMAFGVAEDMPPAITAIGHTYWRAQILAHGGALVTCTIATFGEAGNVDAAASTAALLAEFAPKWAVMIGIAAGMRDKCALADVVIAERVVGYEGAAALPGGVEQARPGIFRPDFRLQQMVAAYLSSRLGATARLKSAREAHGLRLPTTSAAGEVSTEVMPKPATLASGEQLLRDPDKFRQFRELHGKVEVAEMESVGVFTACHQRRTPALVVRGISDFGDATKDNQFHELAAKAAAIVAVDLIAFGFRT